MKSLRELDTDNNYQTDKLGRYGSPHDYCEAYERHFGPFRHRRVVFWEIGVGRGDSIRMWRDYFDLADVVGIDVEPPEVVVDDTLLYRGDATDPVFVGEILKKHPPDIVLDDGSHKARDMRKSLSLIWSSVTTLYAVEDIGTQYVELHGRTYLDADPFTDDVKTLCDTLAKNKTRGLKRVCWERGQVYVYKE